MHVNNGKVIKVLDDHLKPPDIQIYHNLHVQNLFNELEGN